MGPEHLTAHYYDTLEHDLERLGLLVARLPSEAGVIWRLTLPRGEIVEAWEPGTAGLVPPDEIMELIGSILDGKPLVPESAVLREPGARRLRESLAVELEALLAHDPGVRLGTDPENLHQHRVAARRTRSFLHTARAYVDPSWSKSLGELLSELGDSTGPLRDLDVLIEHLGPELDAAAPEDRAGADRLLELLNSERESVRGRLLAALEGERYRLLLTRLRFPPRFRPGVDDVPLERLARKEFRRLARRLKRTGPSPEAAAIHSLRVTLKRVRYAAELSSPRGAARRRFIGAAKTLQDLLGEHHDTVIAETRLRSATVQDGATAAAFVAGRLAERQADRRTRLTAQLPPAWRRLRRRAPKL
jgi:CHAD domain-containing protein